MQRPPFPFVGVVWADHWTHNGDSQSKDWNARVVNISTGWLVEETETLYRISPNLSPYVDTPYGDVTSIYKGAVHDIVELDPNIFRRVLS